MDPLTEAYLQAMLECCQFTHIPASMGMELLRSIRPGDAVVSVSSKFEVFMPGIFFQLTEPDEHLMVVQCGAKNGITWARLHRPVLHYHPAGQACGIPNQHMITGGQTTPSCEHIDTKTSQN